MTFKLVIAEKPSMAKEIIFALGGKIQNGNGFWTVGNTHLVTFAYGHLFEIKQPSEFNADWGVWNLASLPMIPDLMQYKPSKDKHAQWLVIKNLIKRDDVSEIVNACDAGREGELIFNLIYDHAETTKKVNRLWISSLTIDAIRTGFANLAGAEQYEGLKYAAYLRQEADWLIGLNGTRCQTLVARQLGGQEVFSLGRVQTPVLALIVKRDLTIENFKSVTTWAVTADFKTPSGSQFTTHLINGEKQLQIFDSRNEAESLVLELSSSSVNPFIESLDRKNVSVKQPLMFDLTTLQREMNKKSGWTAAKTLEVAQSLYEGKLTSYPRTSSAYLTTSVYETAVPQILSNLTTIENSEGTSQSAIGQCASVILENGWKLTNRHVDDEKATEHHAIIPTGSRPKSGISKDEAELFEVIAKRFLAAFYPAGTDEKTEVVINLANRRFIARGKRIIVSGWREIELKIEESEDDKKAEDDLPEQTLNLQQNDVIRKEKIAVQEKKSKPPARFTEDSLLGAMETAGKIVDDEEAREAMKSIGIGTPATRADIIEKLVRIAYIERKKKSLISTAKGRGVIELLGDNILTSAELTGKWEAALNRVAEKQLAPERFRQGVQQLARETVASISEQLNGSTRFVPDSLGECPKCQVAGRDGSLKGIRDKNKKPYLVCTKDREVCGFICTYPSKKTYLTKLVAARCPKCKNSMVYRKSKQNETSFLSCAENPKCDGVIWLDQKAKAKR